MRPLEKNFESHFYNDSLFLIDTPMIQDLKNKINAWLWNGCCGAYISGQNRVGKSEMIRLLTNKLENRIGETIPTFSVSLSLRDVKTIASVFRNLCYSLELDIKKRLSADEMSNLVFNYLGEAALTNSTKQVVLFVDEMQFLNMMQINAFAELFNRLKRQDINLSIFFVGNTLEAEPLITKIENGRNELLRGRFFLHKTFFQGITGMIQLITCLDKYDNYIVKPYNIKCTEYFLPEQYKNGWRLQLIAEPLWKAICCKQDENGQGSFPMQYFSTTIRLLLADLLPTYNTQSSTDLYKLCRAAIKTSNWK